MRKALIVAAFLAMLGLPMTVQAGHCEAQGKVEAGSHATHASIPCAPAPSEPTGRSASDTTLRNPLPTASVPQILGNVLRALFGVLGSIALLMFIYGGFAWLTSGGNPEKIKKGKDTMVWAILGIAIIFASYAIVGFVIDALTTGRGS